MSVSLLLTFLFNLMVTNMGMREDLNFNSRNGYKPLDLYYKSWTPEGMKPHELKLLTLSIQQLNDQLHVNKDQPLKYNIILSQIR